MVKGRNILTFDGNEHGVTERTELGSVFSRVFIRC